MRSSNTELSPLIQGSWDKFILQKFLQKGFASLYSRTHGDEWKHNKWLWPYTAVKRNKSGSISSVRVTPPNFRFNLISLDEVPFPAEHTGHIVLSGPSVNSIDYSKLSLPVLMGVNGAIAICRKYPLRFTHYVITDRLFVEQRKTLVEEILSRDLILFASVYALKSIALYIDFSKINCRIVPIETIERPIYLPCPSYADLLNIANKHPSLRVFDAERYFGFSLDPRLGLFNARTVAYDALQLMVWLKMKTIFFHGLDLTCKSIAPRFYETKNDMVATLLHEHFDSIIEPCFKYASEYLKANQINVYNLSLNSLLEDEIFPKISWRKLV